MEGIGHDLVQEVVFDGHERELVRRLLEAVRDTFRLLNVPVFQTCIGYRVGRTTEVSRLKSELLTPFTIESSESSRLTL